MLEAINNYLDYQGMKYIKPEKTVDMASMMSNVRQLAQAARKEFETICKALIPKITPFEPGGVSQWMNQAQICRPHFWCYYRLPCDSQEDVALAIRLYGIKDNFGISVEVSFVERKKSDDTLDKQHKVLSVTIAEPLYYFVQVDSVSHREAGTEENRLRLQEQIKLGDVRKVLVKYDIPLTADITVDDLTDRLAAGFDKVLPYYQATK